MTSQKFTKAMHSFILLLQVISMGTMTVSIKMDERRWTEGLVLPWAGISEVGLEDRSERIGCKFS